MSRAVRQTYLVDGRAFEAELHLSDGCVRGVVSEGEIEHEIDVAARRLRDEGVRLDHPHRIVRATVLQAGDTTWVCVDGRTYEIKVEEPGTGAGHQAAEEDFAISPMTGVLAKVSVKAGETVAVGAELFIVEAMKMEYVVKAPRAVTIQEVRNEAGESVSQGSIVVAFETESA